MSNVEFPREMRSEGRLDRYICDICEGPLYPDGSCKHENGHDALPAEDDKVPAPSHEFQRGFRAGYEQRMAEGKGMMASLIYSGHEKVIRDGDIVTMPVGDLSFSDSPVLNYLEESSWVDYPKIEPVPDAEPDPMRGSQTYDYAKDRLDPEVTEAVRAAMVEDYPDSASSRPLAPSLNQCWNRLDAQMEALQALKLDFGNSIKNLVDSVDLTDQDVLDLEQTLATEKKDRTVCVDGIWAAIRKRDEEFDSIHDSFRQRDREDEALRERIAGDVAALNERLAIIEKQFDALKDSQKWDFTVLNDAITKDGKDIEDLNTRMARFESVLEQVIPPGSIVTIRRP